MNENILKEEIAMLESNNRSLQQYKNNWNELKEWLEDKAEKNMNFVVYRSFFNAVKHKMLELESRK